MKKGIVLVILMMLLGVLIVSCKGKKDEPPGSVIAPKELTKMDYPEVPAPAASPVFRWDFSEKHNYIYDFKLEMASKMVMDSMPTRKDKPNPLESISAGGLLLIKSNGDGTADMVLKDLKMTTNMDTGEKKPPEKMDMIASPMVIQGMKEDGSGVQWDSSQKMLLQLLFPLPTKELKKGESVEVPVTMPFNAMGSPLKVTGYSRITLTRYVKIGGQICAQLDVVTDISKLNVPSEIEGTYETYLKGPAVFYFDVKKRCFIRGAVSMVIHMKVDAPMPKVSVPGSKPEDMPKRMTTEMDISELINVTLQEEK